MRVVAAILAAGGGTRCGGNKILERLGDRRVWQWSFDTFQAHPSVDGVVVVGDVDPEGRTPFSIVPGGATRQESARAALLACPPSTEILLLHDAARPFISPEVIDRVLAGVERSGAAAPGVPVVDTIRERLEPGYRLLDRSKLVGMQTPQGVRTGLYRKALDTISEEFTDDLALMEAIRVTPEIVAGDPLGFKITLPADLERARGILGTMETRTGLGYDIHAFSDDPSRRLMLGGVYFPGHRALDGHSDADVVLHAAVDALLGAAALGDIGQHFPNTDPRWAGEPSLTFLAHARDLIAAEGWSFVHLDIAVIAESPKVMKRAVEIRTCIAEALGTDVGRVSLKATTNEGLGSIGRGEGISAFATATIRR